jgi:hypothetical protein
MWRSDGYAAELLSVVDGMLALSTIQDKQICLLLEQRWVLFCFIHTVFTLIRV